MKIRIVNSSNHPLPAHEKADWEQVDVLVETDRGAGGFGHTGTS